MVSLKALLHAWKEPLFLSKNNPLKKIDYKKKPMVNLTGSQAWFTKFFRRKNVFFANFISGWVSSRLLAAYGSIDDVS